MRGNVLFTRDELAAAFALLFPRARAEQLASQWFEQFAHTVDEFGRFVHTAPLPFRTPPPDPSVAPPDSNAPECIARDERFFHGWSDEDMVDRLMGLSSLHLALVALVSDDLFGRMQRARNATDAQAARSRLQLERAIAAFRRDRDVRQ